jgi:hypothetical protein
VAIEVDFTGILDTEHRPVYDTGAAVGRHISDDVYLTNLIVLEKSVECLGFRIVSGKPADGMNAIRKQAIEN